MATSNPSKMERLQWLLDGLEGVHLVRVDPLDVAEGSHSVRENARLKACAYAATYSMYSVATDGGLVVPALGSRWNPALTGRRREELLGLMRDVYGTDRAAMQLECVAVADHSAQVLGEVEALSTTRCVADEPDAREPSSGFWLPGMLLYGPSEKRFGDLTPGERTLADDHWLALRDRLRTLVVSEITRAGAPSRQPRP